MKKNGDDLRTRYYLDGGKYKLKPYVNINKKPGFDELLESLEVIRHCKKNQFTMNEIYHDHLVKDFVGMEKIIEKYI